MTTTKHSLFHTTPTRGFTIVELLIVIVVIGILASVTLVSYNGAVLNAKTSQASANATLVQKKIEAYATTHGGFPSDSTYTSYRATLNASPQSSLASNTDIKLGTVNAANTGNIQINQCTQPSSYIRGMSYQILYWDFGKKAVSTSVLSRSYSTIACSSGGWTALI